MSEYDTARRNDWRQIQRRGQVLAAVVGLLMLAGACATNPVTGNREFALMSEAQELALGRQADGEIQQQMGIYEDDVLQRYVEEVGLSLAAVSHRPDLPWQFIVLGHEVGHVTARHAVQAYTRASGAQIGLVLGQVFVPQMRTNPYVPGVTDAANTGLGLLFLRFGRDDEMQADRLGAEYAAQSGWHPEGVGDMLSTLGRISQASDRRGRV
jgi:predicted Zn-dependent protease